MLFVESIHGKLYQVWQSSGKILNNSVYVITESN